MRFAILWMAAFSAAAQTVVVEGDLVDAITGAPVAGASVSPNNAIDRALVFSDAAGHFRLTAPVPVVTVIRPGYLRRSLPLKPAVNSRIELTPQAVITGRIVDDDGFPVANAMVTTMRYVIVDGERKLEQFRLTVSDDLGEYRVSDLPAGRYYLRVSPDQLRKWDARYAEQYYGGAAVPRDQDAMVVSAGQERGHVDFRITKQEGVTVSGRVTQTVTSASVSLQPDDGSVYVNAFGPLHADGSFIVRHVAPGNYKLVLRIAGPPVKSGDWMGELPVQVGSHDIGGLLLEVRQVQPVDVRGSVVFEGGASRPVEIGLRRNTGEVLTATPGADGSFVAKGLLPGDYTVMVREGYETSVQYGNTEVLRERLVLGATPPLPLKITVATAVGRVQGTVVDGSGHPAGDALVLLQRSGAFRLKQLGDNDGKIVLAAPAGDYRVYAVTDSHRDDLEDPAYLKVHENDFPPLHVVEGKNPDLTLRLPK